MKKVNSCADPFEADAISVEQAKAIIFDQITPLSQKQKRPLRDCLNRFIANDIISPINVPSHTNSAMDGYAIASADLPVDAAKTYPISGITFAGKPSKTPHKKGHVTRIMTGGVMPEGTDTVIMQEQAELLNNKVSLLPEHKAGQNVRQAGEDIAKGMPVFSKRHQLTPADIGVLASLGISELYVYRRPRVAFFSTGDELCSVGETLKKGEIYDSNRYTLFAMLSQLNVKIIDMGVIEDKELSIKDAMKSASELADIVITSGGVSVGEADYIKPCLESLGEIHFKKVAMKPGRPLTFGTLKHSDSSTSSTSSQSLQSSWFFGLPGNPVAVMITFMQFIQPAIQYLSSGQKPKPLQLKAKSSSTLYKRPGRTEFQRGVYEQMPNGELSVKRTGKQGSGILRSMSIANCFIILPSDCSGVEAGDSVDIQIF